MKTLMDYSVFITGLLVLLFLGTRTVLQKMKKSQLNFIGYSKEVIENASYPAERLFVSLLAIIFVSTLASMVIFHQIWSSDVFQVTFVALLLRDEVERLLYKILEV